MGAFGTGSAPNQSRMKMRLPVKDKITNLKLYNSITYHQRCRGQANADTEQNSGWISLQKP